MRTSVNIIGAGLAGLSAALTLARAGVPCTLVSPQPSERAQSVMAEGGINAALDVMGEGDSVDRHFEDTMAGGVFLADPHAVRGLVDEAPAIVDDLIGLGVPFQVERGALVQRNFGGQKNKRTAYAQSSTGKALMTALIDGVRRYEAQGLVRRLPHHALAGLDVRDAGDGADGADGGDGGTTRCHGCWITDVRTGAAQYLSGTVVLATGGYAGLFGGRTTGTTVNTGDATACAYAAGIALANLEFIQYHPTTIPIAGKRLLISEAARGEGGRLFAVRNGVPWYFMEEKYPELGNLMPRDVVSREEVAVMADPDCTGRVWLDMRHLPRATWAHRLPDLREECQHYLGLDPAREPLPVEPGIHYCMGGIFVDAHHRTSAAGLYAAGECACQYHGANRLGGNSLLGAIYGGRVAARAVLADGAQDAGPGAGQGEELQSPPDSPGQLQQDPLAVVPADATLLREVERILDTSMGMRRDGDQLAAAIDSLEVLYCQHASARMRNRLRLAQACLASALARTESRGAHMRADYPASDDAFLKTTVVQLRQGAPQVSFRTIGEAL